MYVYHAKLSRNHYTSVKTAPMPHLNIRGMLYRLSYKKQPQGFKVYVCRAELENRLYDCYNNVTQRMCLTAFRALITAPMNTVCKLQLWYRPKKTATEADIDADEVGVVDEADEADVVDGADEADEADGVHEADEAEVADENDVVAPGYLRCAVRWSLGAGDICLGLEILDQPDEVPATILVEKFRP